MVWLPRTAVGEGDEPGLDGEAKAAALPEGVGVDGDPDCASEGEGCCVVADGDALCVTVGDRTVELAEALGVA